MGDIYEPLGAPKGPSKGGPKGRLEPRDPLAERLERGALSMSVAPRTPWMRWAGVGLVAASLFGMWWWAKPVPADAGAVAAIDRTVAEAPIGPRVDLRTAPDGGPPAPRAEPTGTASPSLVVLDEAPPPVETLPAVTSAPTSAPLAAKHPVHLPRPELIEDSAFGPLPRVAGGVTPFDAYRVAGPVAASRVAIVIGGLGLSQTGSQRAIRDLPAAVTLAFSPDGNSLRRWTQAARRDGHEIALQVPLAPIGYPEISDSPRTLAAGDDVASELERSLGRITTYASVAGHGGGAFAPDEAAMGELLEALAVRGLGYIDHGGVSASRAAVAVKGKGLPFTRATIVLDDETDPAAIDRQLDRLVAQARRTGRAVAIGSALPTTIERVRLFADAAAKHGVTIVPVSNLMKRR